MNLINKILKVSKNIFFSFGRKNPKVMSDKETIEYILKNNVSIGRFGDGEIELIQGKDLNFQKADDKLSKCLSNIVTTNKFLVCIPNVFNKKFFNSKLIKDNEYKIWKKHKMLHGYLWKKMFAKQTCGDSFISRFYMRYNDTSDVGEYVSLFKKLWDKRNIIIVEGESSKIGCENDLLNNSESIRRIICPSVNAFDFYETIFNEIKNNYNEGDLVILALGPTATVLAYDLSNIGIQALDLGHFDIEYEWFLANATIKIPVKNKHVNECASIGNSKTNDLNYKNEIIKIIK